jgi:hypothetical protein
MTNVAKLRWGAALHDGCCLLAMLGEFVLSFSASASSHTLASMVIHLQLEHNVRADGTACNCIAQRRATALSATTVEHLHSCTDICTNNSNRTSLPTSPSTRSAPRSHSLSGHRCPGRLERAGDGAATAANRTDVQSCLSKPVCDGVATAAKGAELCVRVKNDLQFNCE